MTKEKETDQDDEEKLDPEIQKCLDAFPEILESFEKKHPKWGWEVTYWILDGALKSLRHYLEDASDDEISWSSPFVRLQFAVDCSWNSDTSKNGIFSINSGFLTREDVETTESASEALSEILVRHLEVVTLENITGGVALQKDGERYFPVLSAEVAEALEKISDAEERQRQLDLLFEPVSYGAGSIDIDFENFEEGQEIEAGANSQLQSIEEPLISIPMEIEGHPIRVIAIFEVHPLLVDPETRGGHFPLITGLAIQSDSDEPIGLDWFDQPWTDLANWSEENRKLLWDSIDDYLKTTLKILNEEPELEEAVVSVNASIKVSAAKGEFAETHLMQKEVLAAFQNLGEVLDLEFHKGPLELSCDEEADDLPSLIQATNEAASNQDKGKSLEELMVALFSSIDGFSVESNIKTKTEEIDLWIENESDSFRSEGEIILVECKNWSGRCGKNEFVLLKEKAINRGGRCSIAFLVSWNGFADTITQEMLRGSREGLLIVPLEGQAISDAVEEGMTFLSLLKKARKSALSI